MPFHLPLARKKIGVECGLHTPSSFAVHPRPRSASSHSCEAGHPRPIRFGEGPHQCNSRAWELPFAFGGLSSHRVFWCAHHKCYVYFWRGGLNATSSYPPGSGEYRSTILKRCFEDEDAIFLDSTPTRNTTEEDLLPLSRWAFCPASHPFNILLCSLLDQHWWFHSGLGQPTGRSSGIRGVLFFAAGGQWLASLVLLMEVPVSIAVSVASH